MSTWGANHTAGCSVEVPRVRGTEVAGIRPLARSKFHGFLFSVQRAKSELESDTSFIHWKLRRVQNLKQDSDPYFTAYLLKWSEPKTWSQTPSGFRRGFLIVIQMPSLGPIISWYRHIQCPLATVSRVTPLKIVKNTGNRREADLPAKSSHQKMWLVGRVVDTLEVLEGKGGESL